MTERRRPTHQRIVIRSDGSAWDEAAYRDYLAALDARAPKRATVERLSKERAA